MTSRSFRFSSEELCLEQLEGISTESPGLLDDQSIVVARSELKRRGHGESPAVLIWLSGEALSKWTNFFVAQSNLGHLRDVWRAELKETGSSKLGTFQRSLKTALVDHCLDFESDIKKAMPCAPICGAVFDSKNGFKITVFQMKMSH